MDDDDFDAAGAAAAVLGTDQDAAGDATVYGALASAAAVEDALEHHTHTPAEIGAAPAVHTHTPASIGAAAESHEHDAADITSGVLDDELIPNLDASKITSGTFDGGRLPTVPITKGGTGATDAAAARTALGAAAANHTHTAADVGAADAVHSHAAEDITSGTLASDRLPTVPVSKGGTGATNAAGARTNLNIGGVQVNNVQLGGTGSGRQAVEGTLTGGNVCMMALKRGEMTMAIVLADVWSTNLAVWGELPADLHFIRGSASGASGSITIQNNLTIGGSAIAIDAVGLKFGEVTTTDAAIAENFTRTVMDDFVPSTGGSFSGNVVHEDANVFVDDGSIVSGTTPSANQYSKGVWIRDAQNAIIGLMNTAYYTNGRQALRLLAQRVIGGTTLYNGLMCWIDDNGNRGISVDDAAAWRSGLGITPANIGALPSTGGAATGSLGAKSANIDRDGANPSSAQTGNTLYLCDKDGERIGMFRVSQATNGAMQMALAVFSEDGNGEHGHWLNMSVGKSGACTMSVTDAAAWRSGLGITPANIEALPISGGQMTGPLSMKDATAMPHATGTGWYPIVMSGFGSGGAIKYMNPAELLTNIGGAAASHTHAASDIASGTVPIARGGTGATSASAARTALGIGEQLDDVVIADISLPSSNQTTILGTMTVPAGKWLLKGVAYFAANSSGDRKVYLGTGTSYANQRGCAVSAAPGNQVCIIEVMPIMTFTKNTVVNLIPYQSSGSALSTRGMISAVRLA